MKTSKALLVHALQLVEKEHAGPRSDEMREVTLCRAVSAAYYALFHDINASAVALIAPNVPESTNCRIQRWFEHAETKKVCTHFLKPQLERPLRGLIGETATPEMKNVAGSFIRLQEARHRADYDLDYTLGFEEARDLVFMAAGAMEAWDRIKHSAEANIFILSLLLWKNWEKER